MVHLVIVLLAAATLVAVSALPIRKFMPFNGPKVCLYDTTIGLVHTSNVLDSNGVSIDDVSTVKCEEFRLSPNDDGSLFNLSISFSFPYFESRFRNLFVNTNGMISFINSVSSYTPEPFPIKDQYFIAPYWADIDTGEGGEIYIKETTDISLLQVANDIIQSATTQAMGISQYSPQWMLIATWHNVGRYTTHHDKSYQPMCFWTTAGDSRNRKYVQTNTFQTLLVTDGRHSFVVFNYLDDGISWTHGDASQVDAQVGFNFGGETLRSYSVPTSRTAAIANIEEDSNTGSPGQYVYRVDSAVIKSGTTTGSECDDLPILVDPDIATIINGGVMTLTGPRFNKSTEYDDVTCVFSDKEGDVTEYTDRRGTRYHSTIKGIIVHCKAICPMPLFRRLGAHKLNVTVKEIRYFGDFEVVPAVFKIPDIHIFDGDKEIEFALIGNQQNYIAKWNSEQLSKNEFKENGTISFKLENWFYFLGQRWRQRGAAQNLFVADENADYNKGNVTFRQSTNAARRFQFDISVIVLVKQTKNLKILYTSSILSFAPRLFNVDYTRDAAILQYCNLWFAENIENIDHNDLQTCPCTIDVVRFDPDFIIDPTCSSTNRKCHENIHADLCFLKHLNVMSLGQQCCYDVEKNYITTNGPAGSADYYFPTEFYLQHQSSDYFPYKTCCVEANDAEFCEKYYSKRPKDISNGTSCTPSVPDRGNGGGRGDRSVDSSRDKGKNDRESWWSVHQSLKSRQTSAVSQNLYPYNDGRACTINTTTGLVYNDMSNEGRWFEILDGVNCTEYKLSPNNDGSSGRIPTSVPFQVFQHVYNSLSVNTDGIISFTKPFTYSNPKPFPIDNADVIAPYWSDFDITQSGNIYFKETVDAQALKTISAEVGKFDTRMNKFTPHWAFIATWENVQRYGDNSEPITFQTVLTTNGRHSFALFLYENEQILADISMGGDCKQVQVGFSAGNQYGVYNKKLNNRVQIKSLSSCQQNQTIFSLDNKEIFSSGCNRKGFGVVDRKFVPITGGGLVTVSGPCFHRQAKKILCNFEHVQTVGRKSGPNTALCPLPLFTRLGPHVLQLSDDNGTTFKFNTLLRIVPAVYHVPDVMLVDSNGQEKINDVLEVNQQYTIDIRNEPWSDKYEINHMIYSFAANKWIMSPMKLDKTFQPKAVNSNKRTPTPVSVIQVVKKVNRVNVAYTSAIFTLANKRNLGDICKNWIKTERKNTKSLQRFPPCPCTLQQARFDAKYVDDAFCTSQNFTYFSRSQNCKTNRGAHHCMITKLPMYNGAGQQCCYDDNGVLITGTTGKGTAWRSSLFGNDYFGHFENDYFPYLVCCAGNCDAYYNQRPTDNCSDYVL